MNALGIITTVMVACSAELGQHLHAAQLEGFGRLATLEGFC
jgi:hypothetical protein